MPRQERPNQTTSRTPAKTGDPRLQKFIDGIETELGAFKLPGFGGEKKDSAAEIPDNLKGLTIPDFAISNLIHKGEAIEPGNPRLKTLFVVNGMSEADFNALSDADKIAQTDTLIKEQHEDFLIASQAKIADRVRTFGIEPDIMFVSPFGSEDKWSTLSVLDSIREHVTAGAFSEKEWLGNLSEKVDRLAAAHIRVEGIKALDALLEKYGVLGGLGSLKDKSDQDVKAELARLGLDLESTDAATNFLHSQFEDKATKKINVEAYAVRVVTFRDKVEGIKTNRAANEKLKFKDVRELDEGLGVVQVDSEDSLREQRSKVREVAIDVAMDKTGETKRPKVTVITDDDGKIVSVGRFAKKHKKAVIAGTVVGVAAVGFGGYAITRGGGNDVAVHQDVDATSTAQVGSIITAEYSVTATDIAIATATATAISTATETATAIPSTSPEASATAIVSTTTPDAGKSGAGDATPGAGIETAKKWSQLNQGITRYAVDRYTSLDDKIDGSIEIKIEDKDNFTKATERTLVQLGVTDSHDIASYVKFIQKQQGRNLNNVYAGDVITLNPDLVNEVAYIQRTTEISLPEKIANELLKAQIPVDDSIYNVQAPDLAVRVSAVGDATNIHITPANFESNGSGGGVQASIVVDQAGENSDEVEVVASSSLKKDKSAETDRDVTRTVTAEGDESNDGQDDQGRDEDENDDSDSKTAVATASRTVTVSPTNAASGTAIPTETSTPTPTAISTEVPATGTATSTVEATPEGCITTDVKGEFTDTGHYSENPVKGVVSNIAANKDCSDDIYVHMYGSMQVPETSGWIESQKGNHIKTIKLDVPQGTVDKPIEFTVPNTKFCWVQVDLTRDGEIKDEPRYIDNDYVFVKDTDSCLPTATATNTATSTVTFTATSTNTPEKHKKHASPTNTNTPEPTATSKATETPVPAKTVVSLPKTGDPRDEKQSWMALLALGLGVVGLGTVIRSRFAMAPAPVNNGVSAFEQRLLRLKAESEEEKKKWKESK